MDRFESFLRNNGKKVTSERIALAKLVLSFKEPFSIRLLWERIQSLDWPISESTMHRTIPMLIDANLLEVVQASSLKNRLFRTVPAGEGKGRIDCSECGKTILFELDELDQLHETICREHGFREIATSSVNFAGRCHSCAAAEEKRSEEKREGEMTDKKDIRVFLIDDEEILRLVLEGYFADDPTIDVRSFENPTEWFCDLEHEGKCPLKNGETCGDAIVTDITMPIMNGVQFVEKLTKKGCRIKHVAFMTGNPGVPEIDVIRNKGYKLFRKPFSAESLFEWIRSCRKNLSQSRKLTNVPDTDNS